jgi:hypothetical protein
MERESEEGFVESEPVPRTAIGGSMSEEREISMSLSDSALGSRAVRGVSSIDTAALPLEIDGVWLTAGLSGNEGDVSEALSFSGGPTPRVTAPGLVVLTMTGRTTVG